MMDKTILENFGKLLARNFRISAANNTSFMISFLSGMTNCKKILALGRLITEVSNYSGNNTFKLIHFRLEREWLRNGC